MSVFHVLHRQCTTDLLIYNYKYKQRSSPNLLLITLCRKYKLCSKYVNETKLNGVPPSRLRFIHKARELQNSRELTSLVDPASEVCIVDIDIVLKMVPPCYQKELQYKPNTDTYSLFQLEEEV